MDDGRYTTIEAKYPPEGYTVVMEWDSKGIPPSIDRPEDQIMGSVIGDVLPKSFSMKCVSLITAASEAKKWFIRGYRVKIYQTINLVVFNDMKK